MSHPIIIDRTHSKHPAFVRYVRHCDLPSARTYSIPCCPLSHEAPFCFASPPPFTRQEFLPFKKQHYTLFQHYPPFLVPVLAFEFGLATWVHPVPPRVAPPIFRNRSESGACSLGILFTSSRFPWRYASVGAMTVGRNYERSGYRLCHRMRRYK